MNNTIKHKDKLEKSRALIMQISIIASLLILLFIFETKSSSVEENLAGFTEINLEVEKYNTQKEDLKPPTPNILNMDLIQTNKNIKLTKTGFENVSFNIDKQAQFIGGAHALRIYFSENKQYSDDVKKKDIQGRVNVSFIIDKNGKVKNAKVIRSIHPLINTEALRLINAMPNWKPAETNGKAIESKQILPIMFINTEK